MSNSTRSSGRGACWVGCALSAALACIWPALAAASDLAWQAQPYQLGQGLYFPQQALRVGGYTDIKFYGLDNQRNALSVEDMSLFLTKDIGARWKLFTETELGDALTVSGHHVSTHDANIDVERLYADYHANGAITLRFGKFLTPVGQWNLVHADPLVWTVSRPLTTTAAFSRHATGAMMYGTVTVHDDDLDYWLFVDDSKSLSLTTSNDLAYVSYGASSALRNNFLHAIGGQFLYHMLDDRLSLGASFVSYELSNPKQQYRLAGLDLNWTSRYIEFSSEAVYRTGASPQIPDEYGGFLQAVIPLPRNLYVVGRYERYRSATPNETTTIRTVGLNYRPLPSIVLKLEHLDGIHNAALAPNGWFASVGVLF